MISAILLICMALLVGVVGFLCYQEGHERGEQRGYRDGYDDGRAAERAVQ